MAKRFMYVSIGVLCLVVAFELGARRAVAAWSPVGQVWGATGGASQYEFMVFSSDGQAWREDLGTWSRASQFDLPIPGAEVKFLEGNGDVYFLVAADDRCWHWDSGQWNATPFPGGPVALEQESWGRIKAKHRLTE